MTKEAFCLRICMYMCCQSTFYTAELLLQLCCAAPTLAAEIQHNRVHVRCGHESVLSSSHLPSTSFAMLTTRVPRIGGYEPADQEQQPDEYIVEHF
jgi:hypothetical protein